ncbi:MAG: S41 family peptidase [Nannocystaceae bacterium]
MLPASNRGFGTFLAFPDTCLTPILDIPVPIPYLNAAFNATATVFSPNIMMTGFHALAVASMLPISNGDEPGRLHYSQKGLCMVTFGNFKIFLNFLPAATLTSTQAANLFNAPQGLIAVPSLVNVFLTLSPEPSDSAEAPRPEVVAAELAAAEVEGALREDGVGVVAITRLSGPAVARAIHAIERLIEDGARALELDLRGNHGGDTSAAVRLAGLFVPRGTLLATILDADGDRRELRTRQRELIELPLSLRVDGETASAAELLASSLSRLGRAQLLGGPTYGKTSVQALVGPPGAGRYATVGRFEIDERHSSVGASAT